ncbi:hypothetical protein KY342_04190 [Candidatus Woesearchaeota archaeon]|nr:hypothetical protein [Candidatus Woesearchaeota archaeon]
MEDNKTMTIAVIAIVAVVALASLILVLNKGSITGAAVGGTAPKKTSNTPCARTCTQDCTPNAQSPAPGTEELSVHDCIIQCLNARCGQASHAGNCNPDTADGCCNIFAAPGQDPDCIVAECPCFTQADMQYWISDASANNSDFYYIDDTVTGTKACNAQYPSGWFQSWTTVHTPGTEYFSCHAEVRDYMFNLIFGQETAQSVTEPEMLACRNIVLAECPAAP